MTTPSYYRTTTTAESYEPYLVDGVQFGEVHWLRTEGADGSLLATGLWRSQSASFPYPFAADETINILKGRVTIELANGETLQLEPGDVVSFAKGVQSTWTVTDGFVKHFVVSGPAAP